MNNGNSKISAFFARIEGRVQGVGFRYSCAREGKALGLSGWVRNTNDGDVEVWAEGRREKLDALAEWLKRGPPSARVIRKSGLIPRQTFGLRSAPAERKQRHDKIWY